MQNNSYNLTCFFLGGGSWMERKEQEKATLNLDNKYKSPRANHSS